MRRDPFGGILRLRDHRDDVARLGSEVSGQMAVAESVDVAPMAHDMGDQNHRPRCYLLEARSQMLKTVW